jgi:hypothetical protein
LYSCRFRHQSFTTNANSTAKKTVSPVHVIKDKPLQAGSIAKALESEAIVWIGDIIQENVSPYTIPCGICVNSPQTSRNPATLHIRHAKHKSGHPAKIKLSKDLSKDLSTAHQNTEEQSHPFRSIPDSEIPRKKNQWSNGLTTLSRPSIINLRI